MKGATIAKTPNIGMGGLSTNYTLAVRQVAENNVIGFAPINSKKNIIFLATNTVGKGGKAFEFSEDAKSSGVPLLPGGDQDDLKLLHLDGSTSVALCKENPKGVLNTIIKGSKHVAGAGFTSYYINTYIVFDCAKPRP